MTRLIFDTINWFDVILILDKSERDDVLQLSSIDFIPSIFHLGPVDWIQRILFTNISIIIVNGQWIIGGIE